MPQASCLDDDALGAYVDGGLTPEEVAAIDAHIDGCRSCRGDLSAIAIAQSTVTSGDEPHTGTGEVEARAELLAGDRVGRYVVMREHARGGMGVVAVAYDPELGRNVAVKVLRPEISAQLAGAGVDHVREEARAMARLSHPNVVSVHDVGEHAGQIFLAMELVEGTSLRTWLAAEPRSWREIVTACVAAGRGLAAAHRAGLVHRDFKSDNVLCGPDDRVRVTDFGLARGDTSSPLRRLSLTSFAGTPIYMAPEVWRREPATARSDQWSFCVTLHEALHGAPPFPTTSGRALADAVLAGTITPPRARVPAAVTRVIARGLRVVPAERFASMDELLGELDAVLRRRRARWVPVVAVGALALGALALYVRKDAEAADPCQIDRTLLVGVWDASRRDAINASFASSGRKHAPATARRISGVFDSYGEAWIAARKDACVATRIRGDQSDAILDARVRCLDRRRSELGGLTTLLGDHPTPAVVDKATEAALVLYPVETCSAAGVATEQPLPTLPARAAEITVLDGELAALRGALPLKHLEETARQVRGMVEHARALGYPPLLMRATTLLSSILAYLPDDGATERALHDSMAAAAAAHDDGRLAEAWVDLVGFTISQQADAPGTLKLARLAEVALARVDIPGLRGALLYHIATALHRQGKLAEAKRTYHDGRAATTDPIKAATIDGALASIAMQTGDITAGRKGFEAVASQLEDKLGPEHPRVGFALINLGLVQMAQQDDPVARKTLERAAAILADTVGKGHVSYALAVNNLGVIEARNGQYDAARQHYQHAITVLDAHHHPEAANPRANLGNLELLLDHGVAARRYFEQAMTLMRDDPGKQGEVSQLLVSLGNLDVTEKHYDAGEAKLRRGLALADKLFGERHPRTAEALEALGYLYRERGNCRAALPYQARVLAIQEAVYGKDHELVAGALTRLGECQWSERDRAAIATLGRAIAIQDATPAGAPAERAFARWTLARALRTFHADPARARALATQARALYERSAPADRGTHPAAIDRWLAGS